MTEVDRSPSIVGVPPATSLLEARSITKSFPGMKDVGFTLRAGQVHALMGEDGAGKPASALTDPEVATLSRTMARALVGADPKTHDDVLVGDRLDVAAGPPSHHVVRRQGGNPRGRGRRTGTSHGTRNPVDAPVIRPRPLAATQTQCHPHTLPTTAVGEAEPAHRSVGVLVPITPSDRGEH